MKKNNYWTEEQYEEWLEELYSEEPRFSLSDTN
jgi:hypothetical protein